MKQSETTIERLLGLHMLGTTIRHPYYPPMEGQGGGPNLILMEGQVGDLNLTVTGSSLPGTQGGPLDYAPGHDMESFGARLDQIEERLDEFVQRNSREHLACLNTLAPSTLRLRQPVAVTVEFDDDDGYVIARWSEALLEGEGEGESAAMEQLARQVVLAFEDLRDTVAAGNELAGYPARLWRLLTEFVQSQ